MQPQGMTITLRPRSAWEATDLGVALVRAQAGRIFAAWCLLSIPVWIACNAAAWALDTPWLALLAMWWLKPLFDRIPLYAISRAVFGHTPSLRAIVRAFFTWGGNAIAPWLLWRRLHFARMLLLPVDLLERVSGAQRGERVRALTRGRDAGPRHQLLIVGAEFELVLVLGLISGVLLLVPTPLLPDATAALFRQMFENPPPWAQVLFNACVWAASSLTEPFVVGAGFGLYLNRRVQLEAWDIEHAFRHLAARLARSAQVVGALLVLLTLATTPSLAHAASACASAASTSADAAAACNDAGDTPTPASLPALLGKDYRADGAPFAHHLKQVLDGMQRSERDWRWQLRDPEKPDLRGPPEWSLGLGDFMALAARYWLWLLAAAALAFIVYHHAAWLGWLRDPPPAADDPAPLDRQALAAPEPLPTDIPAAVRALWRDGQPRAALALLYRAGVQRVSDGLDAPLPPGATEGQCLRRSRKLADRGYAALFARIVACWQATAYARRLPDEAQIEALLDEWARPAAVPT